MHIDDNDFSENIRSVDKANLKKFDKVNKIYSYFQI